MRFYRFSALCCAILVTPAGGCRFFRTPIVRFCRFLHPAVRFWPPCGGLSFFPHPDRAVLSFFCTLLRGFGHPCGGLSFFPPPDRAVV